MIIGLQIITLTFAFVMIYFAVLHYKRKEINKIETGIWVFVWMFAVLAIVFPDLLQAFARQFKFARLFDMMVVGGMILIIAMVSKTYIASNRMEKKLEKFVREKALKDVKKGRK